MRQCVKLINLEEAIVQDDKDPMMPKRSVIRSESSAKYHRLANVGGDGFTDMQVNFKEPKIIWYLLLHNTLH